MNANHPHYLTGAEVRVGDRVRFRGNPANVVFISDGDVGDFAPGYEEYSGYEPGIMLYDDDGELTFLGEPSEDLEFVRH